MTDKIILAGNPNVGKSSLFNLLTGMKQHTGNWAGKTVGCAVGCAKSMGEPKTVIDTPGTYSLNASSPDEELAAEIICSEECDAIIAVCDACCLERGLFLALQIAEKRSNVILCVNLMDEADRKGIEIDFSVLGQILKMPVVGVCAATHSGLEKLEEAVLSIRSESSKLSGEESSGIIIKEKSREICEKAVKKSGKSFSVCFLDRLLSHKLLAWPIMLTMLFAILWISISGANYPSSLLSVLFAFLGDLFQRCLDFLRVPPIICSAIVDGVYGTTAWVISVMLPPMMIFFPLFTLLEDWGLLPRIAFNMDPVFRKCGGCGKQALCMCMGLGCNAVGVTGCRIISGKREKLIAILTNSFMPCNGRFPTLILLSSFLFPNGGSAAAALVVLCVISLGVVLTLLSSGILAAMIRESKKAPFVLELPPYRKPKLCQTLLRSMLDRTLIVLLRAIKAAAPAGLLIWLLANIQISESSILSHCGSILDPVGRFFGLDGKIMLGFILGLPANEIVLPVILMCYLSGKGLEALPETAKLSGLLAAEGWTEMTIICLMVFCLLHWPCATTLMTIKKESGKLSYALAAAALPTVWGLKICFLIKSFWM